MKKPTPSVMAAIVGLAAVLVALSHSAASAPSPSSVGSEISFLFQNDLDWPSVTQHNGTILVHKPSTSTAGRAACLKLNEDLLSTAGQNFQTDLKALTGYLAFNKQFSAGQPFWIANGQKDPLCAVYSLPLGVHKLPCNLQLPTLCSQTAPYRRSGNTDLSTAYQIQVKSKKLTVVGTRDHLSFRFLGIPYADPFKRFAYSKPYSGSGTISALSFGSPCLQSDSGSEDCLFLNIWTPYLPVDGSKSKSLKPVLFWIHGGGFTGGQASDGVYDGGNVVSRSDVVVVSINYRLGTLGFLALKDGVTNGNFGIADQITGLQWVKDHIADFGGDPSRVTIHGQSAGAGSVRALLAAKPAFGLYKGAIAQSNLGGFGYATTYTEWMSIDQEYANYGQSVVQAAGCSGSANVLACLRAAPAKTLLSAPNAPRYIVVDGKYITTPRLNLNGKGPAANVNVIFGWTRDDGASFVGPYPTADSTPGTKLPGTGASAEVVAKIIANPDVFPLPNGPDPLWNLFNLTNRVGTDGEFICIDQATVISAAKNRVFPSVYAYSFDRTYGGYEAIPHTCTPPTSPQFPNGDPSLPYFRCHSGELYYMFGTLGQDLKPFRDANDLLLSQVSVDAWSAFARSYNPNPSLAYLTARGYTSTLEVLQKQGTWGSVTSQRPLRVFDAPFYNDAWREVAQCNLLGYPQTMFDV